MLKKRFITPSQRINTRIGHLRMTFGYSELEWQKKLDDYDVADYFHCDEQGGDRLRACDNGMVGGVWPEIDSHCDKREEEASLEYVFSPKARL